MPMHRLNRNPRRQHDQSHRIDERRQHPRPLIPKRLLIRSRPCLEVHSNKGQRNRQQVADVVPRLGDQRQRMRPQPEVKGRPDICKRKHHRHLQHPLHPAVRCGDHVHIYKCSLRRSRVQ